MTIRFKNKTIEKPHTVLLQDVWFFKLQQEVLKFKDVYVGGNSQKTVTNF